MRASTRANSTSLGPRSSEFVRSTWLELIELPRYFRCSSSIVWAGTNQTQRKAGFRRSRHEPPSQQLHNLERCELQQHLIVLLTKTTAKCCGHSAKAITRYFEHIGNCN